MRANIVARLAADRWATFDCYGTLIDWERGLRMAFAELWPGPDAQRLLEQHHVVEPRVQAGRALPYREVLTRCLMAVAAIEGLEVPSGRADALADSLLGWPRFFDESGAERSRHVHVAASLFHDIEPAARLGISAVWINRLGESSPLPRAAELPDLSHLPDTLDRLV